MIYLDSSALLKLVRTEPESPALVDWLDAASGVPLSTSTLAEVEVARAAARAGLPNPHATAVAILDHLLVVEMTAEVRERAAAFSDPGLRSLDAIHPATALELPPDVSALVTYDTRLAGAAGEVSDGLDVVAPGLETALPAGASHARQN